MKHRTLALVLLVLIAAPGHLQTIGSNIVLKTAWAKRFRNQLSIDMKMTVLGLNKGKEEDADSHGGSRQNSVGLPMVAEILNGTAATQAAGRAALAPGNNPQKNVYGAWRLWFEHPASGGTQCQTFSGNAPKICEHQTMTGADSNPAHSFEVHPVFDVNGISVARTSMVLTPDNDSVMDTDKAFGDFMGANKILTVVRSGTALTLNSIKVVNNYVQMHVRVTRARVATTRQKDGTVDGGFVIADVFSSTDEEQILRSDVRLFYFRDSEPGDAFDGAAQGDEFTVVGTPRVDLDAVLRKSEGKKTVSMPLPFEFVTVALLDGND
jgi:hypothetical protein